MTQQPDARQLAAMLSLTFPGNKGVDIAAAELRRLHEVNAQLLEACETFSEWLRREEDGFDHKTHDRETPEGEAAWREWFYENLRICNLAQEQARAAIAAAKGEA